MEKRVEKLRCKGCGGLHEARVVRHNKGRCFYCACQHEDQLAFDAHAELQRVDYRPSMPAVRQ